MAQSEADLAKASSIDAMIRNLTERPNVESTLILSRKDGSIIRATGSLILPETDQTAPSLSQGWQTEVLDRRGTGLNKDSDTGRDGADDGPASKEPPRTVETLASSVFALVNHANDLGISLGQISDRKNGKNDDDRVTSERAGPHDGAEPAGHEASATDHQVQLLRLRTRHHEIIVFPDPNYLCCVVQRATKTPTGAAAR